MTAQPPRPKSETAVTEEPLQTAGDEDFQSAAKLHEPYLVEPQNCCLHPLDKEEWKKKKGSFGIKIY